MNERLQSLWQPLRQFGATQTLGMLLWVGLAALTVSLLVLMRTRWGQAQPLSKCVALSIFAHILFAGYAYGTRLFFDPSPVAAEPLVRVTLIDSGASTPTPPSDEEPQWNQYAETVAAEPLTPAPRLPEDAADSALREAPPAAPRAELVEVPAELLPQLPESPVVAREADAASPPQPAPRPDAPAPLAPAPAPAALAPLTIDSPTANDPTANDSAPQPAPPVDSLPDLGAAESAPRSDAEPRVDLPQPPPANLPSNLLASNSPSDPPQIPNESPQPNAVSDPAAPSTGTPQTPSGQTVQEILSQLPQARRLSDAAPMPLPYRGRQADAKLALAQLFGGDEDTEAAVNAALKWLADHQAPDGRWVASDYGAGREEQVLGHNRGGAGADADTAVTGLAVLAFLAAGQTHYEGEFRANIQHGLQFLLSVQQSNGSLAGASRLFAQMYCHGIASLALSESFAMTGDQRLRPSVERAMLFSLAAQDPLSGSWRYQVGDRQGDMSQFGWQVMALKSAELAGIDIPPASRQGMQRFLNNASSGRHRGLAAYRPGEQASRTMTAEALTCRFFLRLNPRQDLRDEAAGFLLGDLPGRSRQGDLYFWYYGTLAMFQHQGEAWQQWNGALKGELLGRQRQDREELKGSWDPTTRWAGYGGRVYSTAMAALCLEVYYRYLPLYEATPLD